MSRLPIARLTLQEVISRRLVLWCAVLSVAFLALFTAGFAFLRGRFDDAPDPEGIVPLFAATLVTVLGLYVVSFLASFLALFLSVGAVSSEADSGVLQAVLARPLRRRSWLLQRWGACAAIAIAYTVLMAGALLGIARLFSGYAPLDPWRAVGLIAAEAVLLLTVGMLGSTRLSTLANGVVVFSLFGLAWLAGVIEFVGETIANRAMVNLGIAVSLFVPSDALWRGASYYAQSPSFVTEVLSEGGLPFSATSPPSAALLWWASGYVVLLLTLAVRAFAKRDL